jgi:magnesium transporter
MIVDCAHYVRGTRQHSGPLGLDEAAARPRSGGSFVWIELHEPGPELMRAVRERFDLHELAVEDAGRAHQRPKVEAYDDFHFLVFKTLEYDAATRRVEVGELDLFLGTGYVIAVRHGPAENLARVRERLETRAHLLKSGPAAVVWGILDAVVDGYRPVVEGLERDIDDVEEAIFAHREDATERIYFLKQEVTDLQRAVRPLIEPLDTLMRGGFGQMDPKLQRYFRDILDHVRRVAEDVAVQRDQLATALDANVSLISVRQNEIVAQQSDVAKQLTVVATVFLPLTFITGFFGQNFGWLTDHVGSLWDFLVFGIGGLVIGGLLLVGYFKRRHFV